MATADTSTDQAEDQLKLRDEWLRRLSGLVETIRGWARDLDRSTRQIEKKMEDSQPGTYKAPALLLQKETVRVLLEPIAHAAPGVEGIVEFYLMPAYDAIVSSLLNLGLVTAGSLLRAVVSGVGSESLAEPGGPRAGRLRRPGRASARRPARRDRVAGGRAGRGGSAGSTPPPQEPCLTRPDSV